MPKTLFVVDDSATMRKVFELTFAGEDLTLVTHDGTEGVMARAREVRPHVAIVDVALAGQQSGYDLVRSLRSDADGGSYPIFVLHSDHSPLDEVAARAAGASGALVKPFETQVMIDRVRQVLGASAGTQNVAPTVSSPPAPPRPVAVSSPPARPPATTAAPTPERRSTATIIGTAIPGTSPTAPAPRPAPLAPGASVTAPRAAPAPVASTAPVASAASVASLAAARAQVAAASMPAITIEDSDEELQLEPGLLADFAPAAVVIPTVNAPVAPAAASPASAGTVSTPRAAMPAGAQSTGPAPGHTPAAAVRPEGARPGQVSGASEPGSSVGELAVAEIARKVGGLGLTAAQVEAITALTREVVERVVWEVVPVLAETLIREEIRRLTTEPNARN